MGIHPTTYYDWRDKGEEAAEAEDFDSLVFLFSNRVKTSAAKAEEKALAIVWNAAVGGRKITKTVVKRKELVEKQGDPDWGPGSERKREQMETDRVLLEEETTVTTYTTLPDAGKAMWFLERRNRKEYGRTLGLAGPDGTGPVKVERVGLEHLSDGDLERLEALLEAADTRADADPAGSPGGTGPPSGQEEPG